MVVKSDEPLLMTIVNSEKKQQYSVQMTAVVGSNLKMICENENVGELAIEFVSDIFTQEPYWRVLDFINFFKWIRSGSCTPLMGNKITLMKLAQWKIEYNEQIANAREKHNAELKSQSQKIMKENADGLLNYLAENKIIEGKGSHPIAIELGRMADSVAAENEKKLMKENRLIDEGKIQQKEKQSHKSFFEPKAKFQIEAVR